MTPSLIEELNSFREKFEQELVGDILPYWINHGVKPGKDGFYGAADLEGNPIEANLSCVLTARILWTYSEAAIRYDRNAGYAQMAHLAYRVLQEEFRDPVYGGYFMEIGPDGYIASDIKHTYAQAFVIYALSKYMEFVEDDQVMEVIRDFYTLLESKAKDSAHPGYFEAFTREWKLYDENRMADNNEPRSMNTHLHVMEAYAALFRVWNDDRVRVRLTELLELFLEKIIRPAGHLGIFFR